MSPELGDDPTGQRHIPLDEAVNFRDLGGYPTAGGGRVRWRLVFRADGLTRLSPADLQVVASLGVGTVLDLRTTGEVDEARFAVDVVPVDFHHLPFLDTLPDPERFTVAPGLLGAQYHDMTRDAAPQIARAFEVIAGAGPRGVVFHCAAGKDRTGVLAALLLALLEVPDDEILADYALSAEAMARLRRKLVDRYPERRTAIEAADAMFAADPANIADLLARLRERHGSIEGYRAGHRRNRRHRGPAAGPAGGDHPRLGGSLG